MYMTTKDIPIHLKKLLGLHSRELKGKEYEQVWMLLQLIKPYAESNNQRSWTDSYKLNGKEYDVTYGITETPIIEEVREL